MNDHLPETREAMANRNERCPERTEEERAYYSLSQRVYAVFAYFYDTVVIPFQKLRRDVANVVDVRADARLLDVATGTGAQALAFAEKVREVVGIDLSEEMLRVARRKNRFPNVRFQQADAADLPFGDESFDGTCVSFALHEMPISIRERVVREMSRVTKPGGSVIVVDYGLPQNRVAGWLAFHAVKLYEPGPYENFVKADVGGLLERMSIEVTDRRPALLGVVQIVTGRKRAMAFAGHSAT